MSVPSILVIEDDDILGPSLVHRLRLEGFAPRLATRGAEALTMIARERFAAVISDIRLPDADGEALYRRALAHLADTPILFVTAFGDIGQAVRLVKAGAADYLAKPFDTGDLVERLRVLVGQRQRVATAPPDPETPVLASPAMQDLDRQLARLARVAAPVLIRGESGSGKEVAARRLHRLAGTSPFVAVNCAAIPAELSESTLFGHEKGSFTGAVARHCGYFEEAATGTLFLDEIGELAAPLQAKLLRVLQERSFRRVGGSADIAFRARIVAASNADLTAMVAARRFREDLLFRIAVVEIDLPPLRDRPEDAVALLATFVARLAAEYGMAPPPITADAEREVLRHRWPGNVRELRNRVARALALAEGPEIGARDLFPELHLDAGRVGGSDMATLEAARDDAERQAIAAALRAAGGRLNATASALGISRGTLWTKMKRLGMSR